MAFIIADPCVSTCDTACVEVCPVDCIHGPEDREGLGAEAKERKQKRREKNENLRRYGRTPAQIARKKKRK